MSLILFKILLINKTLCSYNFFNKETYDEIIKTLCNKKKINLLRVLISDIFLYLKDLNILDFDFKLNNKSLKILFISFFVCKEKFYKIVFNNNTEYNVKLKNISNKNDKLIKELNHSEFKIAKLLKLAKNFNEFYDVYSLWEKIDKRINTQKLLLIILK